MFNLRLDAAVTAFFMTMVLVIVAEAMRVWLRELRGPSEPASVVELARG